MAKHRSVLRRNERRQNRSKKTSRLHPERPRLVVSRSLKNFMAQIINDHEGKTLVTASSKDKELQAALKKAGIRVVCLSDNFFFSQLISLIFILLLVFTIDESSDDFFISR